MAGTVGEATRSAGGVLSGLGGLTKIFMGVAGAGALIVGLGMLTGDVGIGLSQADVAAAGSAIADPNTAGEVAKGINGSDIASIFGQSISNISDTLNGWLSGGEAPTVI